VDRHVQQIQECIPALPPDVGRLRKAELAKISENTTASNKSAIRDSFAVIGSICEKVTTNLAAQGIATLVKSLLS
jgi:hypothetical protein